METTILYRVKMGIMEKKMETTVVCWANREIMEKKMETTMNHAVSYLKRTDREMLVLAIRCKALPKESKH